MALNVDLHSHSNFSDGVLSPAELAARAQRNALDCWALTDHDELAGLPLAAAAAASLGLRFVPGVEISVGFGGRTVHILGLGIDYEQADLVAGLAAVRAQRTERAQALAQRLEELGFHGAWEGTLRHVDNQDLIGRVHFARFMLERGFCASLQDAFERYLGDGKPAFIPMQWASLEQAVGWIRAAGGKAVVAHPGRYKHTPQEHSALFVRFRELGGVGVEVVSSSHTPKQSRKYARIARRMGFEASRGSDFHAPDARRPDLGKIAHLPEDLLPVWHDWL